MKVPAAMKGAWAALMKPQLNRQKAKAAEKKKKAGRPKGSKNKVKFGSQKKTTTKGSATGVANVAPPVPTQPNPAAR